MRNSENDSAYQLFQKKFYSENEIFTENTQISSLINSSRYFAFGLKRVIVDSSKYCVCISFVLLIPPVGFKKKIKNK